MKQPFLTRYLLLVITAALCVPHLSFAQAISVDAEGKSVRQTLNLPFAFFNENFGITAAYVYGVLGFPQKQSALLTTVMVGSKGSWNPFENWPWVQKFLGIQWLQFVPFVEFGRVASEWEIERLHSDMKWDAGLGIRALAKGVVVRIDTAVSDEEIGVQMMISQRFQF